MSEDGDPFEVATPDGAMGGRAWGPAGAAPALVFVHANGFCASTYASLLAPLAEGMRIIGLDLRGHGRTRLPADPLALTSWTVHRDDVIAALDVLAPRGAVLAGHSMGATTALLTAAARPDLVRGLVLVDPVIAPRPFYWYARAPWTTALWRSRLPIARAASRRRARFDSREQAMAGWRGRGAFRTWGGSFLADYCRDGLRDRSDGGVELACPPAWEAANYAAQRADPWPALCTVAAPLTLWRAEHGSTCSLGAAQAAARRGARVERPSGTSHFLPMERSAEVRRTLDEMLAAVA
jgi:pimeloyl-ACP methyl ester carboxylesterase